MGLDRYMRSMIPAISLYSVVRRYTNQSNYTVSAKRNGVKGNARRGVSQARHNRCDMEIIRSNTTRTARSVGRDCTGQSSIHQRCILDTAHRRTVAGSATGLRRLEEHAPPFLPLARQRDMGEGSGNIVWRPRL